MKSNKFWLALVIVLVIVNVVILIFLWKGPPRIKTRSSADQTERVLKKRVGLDEEQMQLFKESRQRHFQNTKALKRAIQKEKRQLFEQSLQGVESSEISLNLDKIALIQREIDSLTYVHFLELRGYCKSDQLEAFDQMMTRMVMREFQREKPMQRSRRK